MPPMMGGTSHGMMAALTAGKERGELPKGPFKGKLLGPDEHFLKRYQEELNTRVNAGYLRRVIKMVYPFRYHVLLTFLVMGLVNLLALAIPMSIRLLIDTVLPSRDVALLSALIIVLGMVVLLRGGMQFLQSYLIGYCGERLINTVRVKLHARLQEQPVAYLDNVQAGGAISRVIGDVGAIGNLIFGGLTQLVSSAAYLVIIMVILLAMNWRLTLISSAFLPAFAITFMRLGRRLRPAWRDIREESARLSSRVGEVFAGARVVKAFRKERAEDLNFFRHLNVIFRKSLRARLLHGGLHTATQLVATMGTLTLLWFGGYEVSQGRLTLGALMSFYALIGMMFRPIEMAVSVYNHYQQAMASVERVFEVLDRDPEIKSKDNAVPVSGRMHGDVKFEHVFFGYNKEENKPVLKDFSFHARPGEMVALVGASGAGKSTVVNLLARFYDVTSGRILIDGKDIRDVSLEDYRKRIGLVLQDNFLFHGTLRDNIAYGKPQATEEEVMEAARAANCMEFIREFPKGLDTMVGERGLQVSGGQRQRVSIARAILADPAILILDEATSSLDSEAEAQIQEALERLLRGRTTFVIAHRLSTVTSADKILVLDAGRVVETGSHEELLRTRGRYYEMFMNQFGRIRLNPEMIDLLTPALQH